MTTKHSCNCSEVFDTSGEQKIRFAQSDKTPGIKIGSEYAHRDQPTYYHFHNCKYVRDRNDLIPSAVKNVANMSGINIPGNRWTRLFSLEMERLITEAGLYR